MKPFMIGSKWRKHILLCSQQYACWCPSTASCTVTVAGLANVETHTSNTYTTAPSEIPIDSVCFSQTYLFNPTQEIIGSLS